MKFPNYEPEIESNKYHQLYPFMPSSTFRMLICGPSGCGKTNSLMHMIYQLLYFNKIYLYTKNLEQRKYQKLLETLNLFLMSVVMM